MAKFPEVQVKARGELGAFIGSSRLPEFDDLKNLTYIRAIVMETLRWMPSAPLGLPHCLSQDDEYKGYHIPGGSLVFANVCRGILHNPNDYPQPEVFWPERYIAHDGQIDSSVRDPCTIAFGFGRRICPGSDYAMNLITICVASILHVFHIEVDVDEFGQPAKLSSQGSSDAISAPTSFPIHLTPHSPEAASLVRDIEVEYEDKCFFMEKSELAD
ncbi:hypothetical protein EUX98_g7043 [Antrodiella citrinella]|uniref:Cytochrome P450 n=1 Tax=Antrodiella citrinella TaxID=2447956 RepID=A0A4S4MMP6_9APHY|nr:hypothetical protein EUX98_g7043 [Antrodiella citrinella]